MKIISPFQDFYDRALAYGHDDRTIYVRKPEELFNSHDPVLRNVRDFDFMFNDFAHNGCTGHDQCSISFHATHVLFCGKMYRGIRVTRKAHWSQPACDKTAVYYDADALVKAVKEMGGSLAVDYRKTGQMWWGRRFFYENSIRDWLAVQGSDAFYNFAVENRYVALVSDPTTPSRVINNAKLADYDFYRVMNPAIAYQEIDMYISGVLPAASMVVSPTPDKYKIQAHGFDKSSFRKSPTKQR